MTTDQRQIWPIAKCQMLAFVTGATGFVGSHVARALAAQGADLRLLVRSSSDLRNIQELQAERVAGRPARCRVPEESRGGMRCGISRRRGLSAVGPRSGADVSLQC